MIDFIKARLLSTDMNYLLKNPALEFIGSYNHSTYEIYDNCKAEYKGIDIIITRSKEVYIKGSLHKLHNFDEETNQGHNHGDFTYYALKKTVSELSDLLDVNPSTIRLENVEIGVNIRLNNFIHQTVSQYLVIHKTRPFGELNNGRGKFFGKQAIHKQYYWKIYAKGIQYRLDHDETRFELKVKTMEFLTRVIKRNPLSQKSDRYLTLSDLINKEYLTKLGETLLRAWKETIVYEDWINFSKIPAKDQIFILNCRNPLYWMINNFQGDDLRNAKRRYKGLQKRYSRINLHQIIYDEIQAKWNELLKAEPNSISHDQHGNKKVKFLTFFNHSISRLISDLIKRLGTYFPGFTTHIRDVASKYLNSKKQKIANGSF
ncbi:MAG: hypothetical protein ABJF04_17225 [Reichenbachiella sp.]|uniref:hypothetical protein n=1 Tax=Reichenbachiella sp. TaxID=2184521 RepID=UPI003265E39B